MKIIIALLLTLSISANEKVLIKALTVKSITREKKSEYLILFKEKAAIYKSSAKTMECLNISIREKKPVLVKWNINTLEIIDCKSKRKTPKT